MNVAAHLALFARHLEAQAVEQGDAVVVGGETVQYFLPIVIGCEAELVDEGLQSALGRFFRILHAQPTGGRIARVGENRLALFFPPLVDLCEAVFANEHLAAKLGAEDALFGKGRFQGNRLHHPGVGGDLLAHDPIAARGGADQAVVFVHQRDGAAVEFGFDHVFHLIVGLQLRELLDLFVEVEQVVGVVGVGQRQHGGEVFDGGKIFGQVGRHPLCGRIGRDEFREARFQRL